jgi:hypothetical protein
MRKARKLTPRDRLRLADPVTAKAMDAALEAGRARFEGPMNAVLADIKRLLAGRSPRSLTGAEAVQLMSLKTEFDGIAIQQKRFMEADAAFRLNPGEGGETVDA